MSKLSLLSICCIFATLSLSVNSSPTVGPSSSSLSGFDPKSSSFLDSSLSSDISSNNQSQIETITEAANKIQSLIREKRAASRGTTRAFVYPFENFKSRSLRAKFYSSSLHGNCMELPENWAQSITPLRSCVRIYRTTGCTGSHVDVQRGTSFRNKVRQLFVTSSNPNGVSPRSIGVCA